MKTSNGMKNFRTLWITALLVFSFPNLTWAFRNQFNLDAFDWKSVHVPMKQGPCFFNHASEDVQDFSLFAIDRLVQMAELNRSKCEPMVADSLVVKEQMKIYFDNIYSDKGIIRSDGDKYLQLTCENSEEVFRLQLYNYRLYAYKSRGSLEAPTDNVFYGKCMDEATHSNRPGVTNLDQCLKDVLAEALRSYNDSCNGPDTPIHNSVDVWRRQIEIQEVSMTNAHNALQRIFEMAKSENCHESQDVAKAAVQSAITIGANVVGTAFGGTAGAIGANIGAEAINFMIDYLVQFADRRNTIHEIVSDKNYENSVCMWISLQEKLCQEFSLIPPEQLEKKTCGLRDGEAVIPGLQLIDEYKSLSSFQSLGSDDNGPTEEPGYQVALKDLIDLAFNTPKEFPALTEKEKAEGTGPSKKNLMEILSGSEEFFRKFNKKEEYNRLLKAKQILHDGKELLENYEVLLNKDAKSDEKREIMGQMAGNPRNEREAKGQMLREMGKVLKKIGEIDLSKLLEDFLTYKIKNKEGLDQLVAEELAIEIFNSFAGRLDSYLDNMDVLQDINNGAVEALKPIFKRKLWDRYKTSMRNARKSEKAHLKVEDLTKPEEKRRRLATFAQLRDTLKDCISTQGVFFSHRKHQNFLEAYFTLPQTAAHLDIKRDPTRYLKACSPFMCEDGIPIPYLPNKYEAYINFQQYSCDVLNASDDIVRKMRNIYVETGKVCGKTIHELTNGMTPMSQYNPVFRGVRSLKSLIVKGDQKKTQHEVQAQINRHQR